MLLPVSPDPPVVELKDVTYNTVSLFWIPGFEGDSPITGYYLEYKKEKGKTGINLMFFAVIQM